MSLRALPVVLLLFAANTAQSEPVVIGSKTFAESYILAEAGAQLLEDRGIAVERRFGMGGTKIAFDALQYGAIDFYPEYTGTMTEVILARPELVDLQDIEAAFVEYDLVLLPPLGFNNAYAIAVSTDVAERYALQRISDLREAPSLRIAFAHEFLNRTDGWPGLKQHYNIDRQADGIEHSLAYEAIESGRLDVIAVYTTDGQIERSNLVILEDDLNFFPDYRALYFARNDVAAEVLDLLNLLSGRIDDKRMREMNFAVLDPDISYAEVASAFLLDAGLIATSGAAPTFLTDLVRNTKRHLKLTVTALVLAIFAGVGIAAIVHPHKRLSNAFLYFTGLLQTVPSIALLALLIPLVGVGQTPAIIALFLYSLLPISRSTITAMHAIPPGFRQVAAAMAMTRGQELKYILIPLAMPHVIAGIRTAAVISIGTATLAAFIGAGGLGDPIVTGLALNDTSLILQGAVPAAGLAILTEMLFSLVERSLVVPHMRSGSRPR